MVTVDSQTHYCIHLDRLTADKPRIQRPRQPNICRSLHQRAAVGKYGNRVRSPLKAQQQAVRTHGSKRTQPLSQLDKIDWPMMLMDLHRVAPAQRNVRPSFAGECSKYPLSADLAVRARFAGSNLRTLTLSTSPPRPAFDASAAPDQ